MNKLNKLFTGKKVLLPFITCGDPDLETTAAIVRALVEAGADAVILGIPFSDPTAEGPLVQAANLRAFASGVTTDCIFDLVRTLRDDVTLPLLFMTYANVIFSYQMAEGGDACGAERFIRKAGEHGIDGLIVCDLPFEEKDEFLTFCEKYGVTLISQVAPISEARVAKIAAAAEGFLMALPDKDTDELVASVRRSTTLPCVIASDASEPEPIVQAAQKADGVILASACVATLERHGKDAVTKLADDVRALKLAIERKDVG